MTTKKMQILLASSLAMLALGLIAMIVGHAGTACLLNLFAGYVLGVAAESPTALATPPSVECGKGEG